MMKKLLILVIVVAFGSLTSWGQVGIGTPTPNESAQLDIVAKDKGILIPRVPLQSTVDESTIVNGNVDGLMVYNTEDNAGITPGFYYWYQDSWKRVTTNDDSVDLPDNIVIWDVDNNQFTYVDENGDTQIINVPETLTTLVDNTDGTYTYTSEDGTVTLIDVPADVVNNFEEIINSGPVEIDGDTYTTIKEYITHLVEENETNTTLENNGNGTYTYTSEDDTKTIFDVTQTGAGDPNTNGVIGKEGSIYVDESTGDIYTYAGGVWNKVTGDIKTGEGDPNDNGTPGDKGDIYIDNSTGAVYIYNDQTGEWEVSSDSLTVEEGVVTHTAIDGTAVTFDVTQTGVGDPTTNGVIGKEGDIYVDESTGDLYTYANGAWSKVDGGTTITKNTVNYNGDIIDGLPVVVYEGTTHIGANTAVTGGVDFPSGTNLEGVITISLYQNGSLITSSTTDVNISGERVDFNIGIGNMYQVLPEGDYDVIIYATVNE